MFKLQNIQKSFLFWNIFEYFTITIIQMYI